MGYRAPVTKPYSKGNGDRVTTTASQALTIKPPRLPYPADMKDRYGIDEEAWRALVEAIFPNAQSIGSVALVLAYCKARNLDVFKRNVHTERLCSNSPSVPNKAPECLRKTPAPPPSYVCRRRA